ncbi:MAG: DUF1828 domain-containing protein [Peptococcaceae bacterium]|nr:DUF1828 domain-containing protein [Peptococcaceae bacterium]
MDTKKKPQNDILKQFHEKIGGKVFLVQEGVNRYRVDTPFSFDDGDNLVIVLKNDNNKWLLTDEGHTYMHLSYRMDTKLLQKGNRQRIISSILSGFGLTDDEGELLMVIDNDNYGDALFSFIQGLLKITDITYLNREIVRSTFLEDFEAFMERLIPPSRRTFRYFDKDRDAAGNYIVDCKIDGTLRPIFVFALANDEKVRDTTITLHQFERWGLDFQSVGIFEDQEVISRKVLARLTDVIDRQFSSLSGNQDRLTRYFEELLSTQ